LARARARALEAHRALRGARARARARRREALVAAPRGRGRGDGHGPPRSVPHALPPHADPEHAILAASALVWLVREARRKKVHALYAALGAVALSVALHDEPPDERWRPTPARIELYVRSNFEPGTARALLANLSP